MLIRNILWRMRRAPTLLVALCAALVELIVLAAAGNQWVYDHLIKHESTSELVRTQRLKATLTSFSWRFTPQDHQRMLWLGEIVSVVGLVIVVFLLVFALVAPIRGPRSFVTVFLGTWGIVFGVTQIAAIGRLMIGYGDVFHPKDPNGLGRWWYSVYISTGVLSFPEVAGEDTFALATHGRRGLPRLFLGSVADKIVRGSSVPVLVDRCLPG